MSLQSKHWPHISQRYCLVSPMSVGDEELAHCSIVSSCCHLFDVMLQILLFISPLVFLECHGNKLNIFYTFCKLTYSQCITKISVWMDDHTTSAILAEVISSNPYLLCSNFCVISRKFSHVYSGSSNSRNLLLSGPISLLTPLDVAKTFTPSILMLLVFLTFVEDKVPDSSKLSNPVWSLLFSVSSSSTQMTVYLDVQINNQLIQVLKHLLHL